VESTRALLYQVCATIDENSDRPGLAAAVKAKASSAALAVTKSVIQMHGAIGFTDEYDAGLYLRRAMTLAAQYGNASFQRKRYAGLAEAEAAAAEEPAARRKRPKKKKSIFADQKGF